MSSLAIVLGFCLLPARSALIEVPHDRTFLTGRWEETTVVGPTFDSPLQSPYLMGATPSGLLVLFDYGDYKVKAFDHAGRLAWAYGGRGRGPEEFESPSFLQVDSEGSTWITDPGNLRLVRISVSGAQTASIRIPGGIRRIVPVSDGRFVAIREAGDFEILILGSDGQIRHGTLGPQTVLDAPSLARDVLLASDGGERVFVGFHQAGLNLLVGVEDSGLQVREIWGPELIEFPPLNSWTTPTGARATRLHPEARVTTVDLSYGSGIFFSLFSGDGVAGAQLVDLYMAEDGAYIGSLRLPQPATDIAALPGARIAVIQPEPIPHVKILTWRGEDWRPAQAG